MDENTVRWSEVDEYTTERINKITNLIVIAPDEKMLFQLQGRLSELKELARLRQYLKSKKENS